MCTLNSDAVKFPYSPRLPPFPSNSTPTGQIPPVKFPPIFISLNFFSPRSSSFSSSRPQNEQSPDSKSKAPNHSPNAPARSRHQLRPPPPPLRGRRVPQPPRPRTGGAAPPPSPPALTPRRSTPRVDDGRFPASQGSSVPCRIEVLVGEIRKP